MGLATEGGWAEAAGANESQPHSSSSEVEEEKEKNNSSENTISTSGFPLNDLFFFSGSIEHIRQTFETFGERSIPRSELAAIQRNTNLVNYLLFFDQSYI